MQHRKSKPFKEFQSILKEQTHNLLIDWLQWKANTIKQIADETGLSEPWIAMFRDKKLKLTDVGRVNTLYDYLSPTPLKV